MATAPAPVAAPKAQSDATPKPAVKKGFLNQNAGALYPEGSNEQSPALWRSKQAAPVLEVVTSEKQYEVVGRFNAAGDYVGKEDFDISRTGATLRVRGKAPEEGAPESLVAGIDECVQLPLDADFESISADYSHYTLRITVPRLSPEQVTARVLPPELLRKLESLSMEQAQALLPEGIGPEELIKRLEALPDPGGPAAAGASAPPVAPPPASEPEEEIEEIETPGVASDRGH